MRRDLVVPEQPAGARVEHEQRVRVEHRAGECGAVRPLRRSAPRLRVRVPRVEPPVRVDRDRVPEPAAAGLERVPPRLPDRVELPAHGPGRGVERVDRAAPARRVPDGAREDEAFPDDGRDVDELLGRARQMAAPQLTARCGGERERVRVGRAVDPPVVHGEPVRPLVQRAVAVHPAQRPGGAVERVHVALEVLDVDRLLRRRPGSTRTCPSSSPSPSGRNASEPRGSATLPASIGRSGGGARAREIAVRAAPRCRRRRCSPQPTSRLASTTADGERARALEALEPAATRPRREVTPLRARSGRPRWRSCRRRRAPINRRRRLRRRSSNIKIMITDSGHHREPEARAARQHGPLHPRQPRQEAAHVHARSRAARHRRPDGVQEGAQAEPAERADPLPRLPRRDSVPLAPCRPTRASRA